MAIPVTQSAAQEQATGPGVLQRILPSGQERAFYADTLKTQGYRITSVNYDDPDYFEYEVVKGDQAYEIQIDIDTATGTAAAAGKSLQTVAS